MPKEKTAGYCAVFDNDVIKIGTAINEARLNGGLTICQLSERSGVPVDTIVSWIYKKHSPNIIYLWKSADALNISIDELVGRKTDT